MSNVSRAVAEERPWTPIPPPILPCESFACKMCPRSFSSAYALQRHVMSHSKCQHCGVKLRSRDELINHHHFCSRRFGVIRRARPPPRPLAVNLTSSDRVHHCLLCNRRYASADHLRSHQIYRCEKRYVAPAWCVKI
jgi:hypothetical protein